MASIVLLFSHPPSEFDSVFGSVDGWDEDKPKANFDKEGDQEEKESAP